VIPQEEEVKDFAWLPFDEALERMTFESAKKSIREAQAMFDRYIAS